MLVDDLRAVRVATALGLEPISTLVLPVLGRLAGRLEVEEAVELVRRLAMPIRASAAAVYAIEDRLRAIGR